METLYLLLNIYIAISVTFTTFFLIGLVRNLRKALEKDDAEELLEKVKNQLKLVYIEQGCGMFHLYDKTTNCFIAQGYTEDEMWATAKLNFPKQEFIIEGDNGKAVLVSVKDTK